MALRPAPSWNNPGSVVFGRPVIAGYIGSGDITLMVGRSSVIVELEGISGSITLDSEFPRAGSKPHSGTTGMNSAMSGEFPILKPGMNADQLDGRGDEGRSEAKLEVSGFYDLRLHAGLHGFSGNGRPGVALILHRHRDFNGAGIDAGASVG